MHILAGAHLIPKNNTLCAMHNYIVLMASSCDVRTRASDRRTSEKTHVNPMSNVPFLRDLLGDAKQFSAECRGVAPLESGQVYAPLALGAMPAPQAQVAQVARAWEVD